MSMKTYYNCKAVIKAGREGNGQCVLSIRKNFWWRLACLGPETRDPDAIHMSSFLSACGQYRHLLFSLFPAWQQCLSVIGRRDGKDPPIRDCVASECLYMRQENKTIAAVERLCMNIIYFGLCIRLSVSELSCNTKTFMFIIIKYLVTCHILLLKQTDKKIGCKENVRWYAYYYQLYLSELLTYTCCSLRLYQPGILGQHYLTATLWYLYTQCECLLKYNPFLPKHNILPLLETHSSRSQSDWSSVDSVHVVSWQQLDTLSLLEVQSSKFLTDMGLHLQTRRCIIVIWNVCFI